MIRPSAQELIHGEYTIHQAGELISSAGYKTVFLITGKHFYKDNNLELPVHLDVHHFVKQGANVEQQEIALAVEQFQKNSYEVILSIGGGSVMDLAKTIIYDCIESSMAIPFIAAPTTAGSGSEATHFAVIYEDKKKRSLVHPDLLPKLVILDPQLTHSLPPYQTAVSGMDVLSQAVESYWNVNATDESKEYAGQSITLWMQHYMPAVHKSARDARDKMMESAYWAGKAINITRTTGPHALSYYLTANFNVPHGQAVGLFLSIFFLYNEASTELCSLLGVKDATAASLFIRRAMKDSGLAVTLSELGIEKDAIMDQLLNEVNEERFANNPKVFDKEKLKHLINTDL